MNKILNDLNEEQLEAVKHLDNPLLILAGAGSGKTKTITARLAYLIEHIGIPSDRTLTLTFTNKSAIEMRDRALNLLSNMNIQPPLLCTFHRFGLLFLRFYIKYLGRKADFLLIDNDDRKRIIKNISKDKYNVSVVLNTISMMKNSFIYPNIALETAKDDISKQIALTYKSYNSFLIENNMLDFDDLLLLSYNILDENQDICSEISNKYNYVMVDEYQDTNQLQYKLLSKLCTNHNNIVVVGDDDQSIYSFRGADIRNILYFNTDFINVKIIKLEKNYRSTAQILNIANSLISHNKNRLDKKLISTRGDGKEVEIIESIDEIDEVSRIAKVIKTLLNKGALLNEIAILFRLNALSRAIEMGLKKENLPYKLIGTLRFYERAEIKDIISYLRLVVNLNDDFSLLRIINKPKRGIGKNTQDKLVFFAKKTNLSIFEAFKTYASSLPIAKKHIDSLDELFNLILDLKEKLDLSSIKFIDEFKNRIKILSCYDASNIDREANIDEFYGFFRDYVIKNPMNSLEEFLNDLSLDNNNNDDVYDAISCMSVHSSKGLEFKYVFIVGFEDGFFPILSLNTNIEEERRLAYVAFSRAKDELYLSYVKSRFYKGKRTNLTKSRFLSEANLEAKIESSINFACNDLVKHNIFGCGKVVNVRKSDKNIVLKINFGGIIREVMSSFVIKV